ncbi:uncharacterized protein LOC111640587 isoform X2 [Centruroides sculpturatus]|uniref:uncharacterized protein LOC111640587 isoform X2 n=1 Tax=Centruroides sculpturatus TaxID=218467 RepID=UPI000C6E80D0|nr:uncharacterized protein LOC111640587 isoform X2 [Centruroides sculpturatus]
MFEDCRINCLRQMQYIDNVTRVYFPRGLPMGNLSSIYVRHVEKTRNTRGQPLNLSPTTSVQFYPRKYKGSGASTTSNDGTPLGFTVLYILSLYV